MPPTSDDPKPTDSVLRIRDFPGLSPAVDPHEVPAGASIAQINVTPVRRGELRVRQGFTFVKFD